VIWLDWMNHAECRKPGVDPDLFHPIGNAGPAVAQVKKAKRVCGPCPVSDECLTHSLRGPGQQIEFGVWGGLDEHERQLEKRRRNRHLTAVAS
jgi:WhiB family redox-sensing transcriptional regulator